MAKIHNAEDTLINRNLINKSEMQISVSITVYMKLTDLHGNYLTSKSDCFSESEITSLIRRVNKKRGNYYEDSEIWQAICRVERGKVTNKLRFEIYKRDGNCCRMCGTPGSYDNKLEIDHILPISKGGKSTFDNLQTLCHNCNYNKSNNLSRFYKS